MHNHQKLLNISLLAGSIYFCCISLAHLLGIKIPGIYIYYNIDSYQYQDKIISFLAFGWAVFFYTGSKVQAAVNPILLATSVALAGLTHINISANLSTDSTTPYWVQTILLTTYVALLAFLQIKCSGRRR